LTRDNRRILQTSAHMIQSWRANCDLQILIYNSSPNTPDLDDVAAVTDYVVSYACKGNESSIAEKQHLKDYITKLNSKEDMTTTTLARMILNRTLKTRLISKQEAMVQLAGLDLWRCSESIQTVSISQSYKLRKEYVSANEGGPYRQYANRLKKASPTEESLLKQMTFNQYFTFKKQTKSQSKNEVIPHYVGGKCIPTWPITFEYARSILVIHSPWANTFDIPDEKVMDEFSFKYFTHQFPESVYLDINRALEKYTSNSAFKEPTAASNIQQNTNLGQNDGTEENEEAINAVGTIPFFDEFNEYAGIDFGENYQWSDAKIKLSSHQENNINTWLEEEVVKPYQQANVNEELQLPTLHNGDSFELLNAKDDQQEVLAYILQRVHEWFQNIHVDGYKPEPIRLTITGVAGSGKSYLTNCLVTALRKIFGTTDSVMVMAPTGEAAFNAGGTTVHYAQGVKVGGDIKEGLPQELLRELIQRNRNLMCAVVDERGLLSCEVIGKMEHNVRHTVYRGINNNVPWGHLPIVIIIGDDYQLPSVQPGAFSVLSEKDAKSDAERLGREVFLHLGKHVLSLGRSKRQDESEERFMRVIDAQRAEPGSGQVRLQHTKTKFSIFRTDISNRARSFVSHSQPVLTQEDAEWLCTRHLDNPKSMTQKQAQQIRNDERTLHLFAANEPRNQFNMQKLRETHTSERPVAKIRPTYDDGARKSHFDSQVLPLSTICVGARVEIKGRNILPQLGLFNGAMGTVLDIVYNVGESPNSGNLPRYVLVKFPSYIGKPFINENPKVIPIVPLQRHCSKHCCLQNFIPLRLCFAKTIHSFQGQQAGPVQQGRPENPIQRLVIDLGQRQFESKQAGLSYTAFTRPTTMGREDDITSGALFFSGPHMNPPRIMNIAYSQKTGDIYTAVKNRSRWVKYLQSNKIQTTFTRNQIHCLFHWASNFKASLSQINSFHKMFHNK
jgi:PIF1-like helicase